MNKKGGKKNLLYKQPHKFRTCLTQKKPEAYINLSSIVIYRYIVQ